MAFLDIDKADNKSAIQARCTKNFARNRLMVK